MSSRDYVTVPGFPGLRACVRPFVPHSATIGLCYVGPISELIAAGIATLEMLTIVKSGFDAAGDRYTTDAHWSSHARPVEQRYRIWRRMKRTRALKMPGARKAWAYATAESQRALAAASMNPTCR